MLGRISKWIAAGMMIGLFASPVKASAAALCPDDYMVLLGTPGHATTLYYAYDDEGNRIGRLPGSGGSEYNYFAKLLKKDSVLYSDRGSSAILRADGLEVIMEYGPDDIVRKAKSNLFYSLNNKSGHLTLWNAAGESLGDVDLPSWEPMDKLNYVDNELCDFEDEYLLKVNASKNSYWIRFDKAGRTAKLLSDENILSWFAKYKNVFAFGDYLALFPPYGDEEEKGIVMTRDGLILMDDLDGYVEEADPTALRGAFYYAPYPRVNSVPAVYRQEEDKYELFVSEGLQSIGLVDKESWGDYETAGGYFPGIVYPELMGNKCEGFLLDVEKQEYIPYARSGEEILVLKDGITISLPGEGTPDRISSAYYVAYIYGEGSIVYRMSDKSVFKNLDGRRVSLGSGGIALSDDEQEDFLRTMPSTIYDNQGNPVYHCTRSEFHPFYNGTWYIRRGIYTGLIDSYGNWLLKDALKKE